MVRFMERVYLGGMAAGFPRRCCKRHWDRWVTDTYAFNYSPEDTFSRIAYQTSIFNPIGPEKVFLPFIDDSGVSEVLQAQADPDAVFCFYTS